MDPEPREPRALIVHDGELEDVRKQLEELGVGVRELRGSVRGPEVGLSHPLVVATPLRMLELMSAPGERTGPRPVAIAVLDDGSRTLRANLRRVDVHYLVRRPVHPAALRGLLVHALYRGPERRRAERMSIGLPIRYRTGLWRRSALLTDLSMRGCGLRVPERLEIGRPVRVYLPTRLGVGRTLRLRARVVRCTRAPSGDGDPWTLALAFESVNAGAERRLQNAVVIHACGPARLPEIAGARTDAPAAEETGEAEREAAERRHEPRRRFPRRVITLASEAAGVLLGRDLSTGGMCVEPGLELAVGDRLRIALPLDVGEVPLVVRARVARDDGERGLALRFEGLGEEAEQRLRSALSGLPICDAHGDPECDYTDLVVSELLERE